MSRYNGETPQLVRQIAGFLNNQPSGVSVSDANSITKACSKCGAVKPLNLFHKDRSKKLGVSSRCMECARAATKEWEQSNRERKNESSRKWTANNKKKRSAISAKYSEKIGIEEKRRRLNEWRSKNPGADRAARARRRKQLRVSGDGYSAQDVRDLFVRQRGMCPVCGSNLPRGYHVDHINPLARGGANDKKNIQLLCPSCNIKKNARDPLEFMQSRGFLL